MTIENILLEIQQSATRHPYLLKQLVKEVSQSLKRFDELIEILQTSEASRLRLKNYIERVFHHKDLSYVLLDSGISGRTGFVPELIRKIKHTIIPLEKDRSTFHQTLFSISDNGSFSSTLSFTQMVRLFETLELQVDFNDPRLKKELVDAIEILSYRITATAIESEFIERFKRNHTLNSFIKQNKEVHALISQHMLGVSLSHQQVNHILLLLDESVTDIQKLKSATHQQGASLQLTYSLHRIEQQIERLKLLFEIYAEAKLSSFKLAKMIHAVLSNESKKNSIRKQFGETTHLLAYQITEHESKTGEHYIAEDRKDYKEMFSSSTKGGVFASIMALVKVVFHHISMAPFWQAFAYSINYAAGFVTIQITHSTLATKQPAMTAARIAHSLDRKDSDENSIKGLALMIGQVSRSQFVSFAGNLLVVFPLSFVIAIAYGFIFGEPIVKKHEAEEMLSQVHPFLNPTWFYACITGVFLFVSGIISGFYDNKVIYSNIPLRIRHHAGLRKILSKRLLVRFSRYVENNLGSLIGNICLGFFLGMSGFIGFIFGLPFDIRHITISSANYSIALFTLISDIRITYAITCLFGVLGIGFFNFTVSFGLAIFTAARSRKVRSAQFVDLLKYTWIYFKKYPKDFLFAPKQERKVEDLSELT